jgi:hypothetical protein
MIRHALQRIVRSCLAFGLCVSAHAAAAASDDPLISLPDGAKLHEIDFQRHVLPLLSRYGCNAGTCHGSFQGRGGFRLSLFGHSPKADFDAILSRVDSDEPKESLLLTKPTELTEHGGGRRFTVGSWPYRVLEEWIRQGARASAVTGPPEISTSSVAIRLAAPSATAQLEVQARFPGSEREVVTPFCRFESRDPGVVEVTADGQVRAIQAGATNIIVSYAGGFATVPAIVPFPDRRAATDDLLATWLVFRQALLPMIGLKDPAIAGAKQNRQRRETVKSVDRPIPSGFIDKFIDARLEQLNLPSAPPGDDSQFLRRVTLDVVGRLPSCAEVQEFLSNRDPRKRAKTIDRLLADPQHGSLWAARLCDLTGCRLETMEGPDDLKPLRARMWHEWFRRRVADNVPWDRVVRGVISGTSRDGLSIEEYIDRETVSLRAARSGDLGDYAEHRSLDLFYRRTSADGVYPREALAERVAAAFLGVRIQCARCHKHPYDRWTQGDYAAFVNIFADVSFGSSIELNQAVLKRLAEQRREREAGQSPAPLPRLQEVYDDPKQAEKLPDPEHGTAARPRPLGGPELEHAANARAALADWLVQPANPWFARNWANRVWAHYFGRGLVEPVDAFAVTNPPTHPELLDHLAEEFVRSGYDLRHMERLILNSATYQRSSAPSAGVPDADRYYAAATVRPMMAEAVVQIMDQALGSPNHWEKDAPAGGTLFDVAANRPADPRLAYLLELFGRGNRESVCDCDRSSQPSLRQTLHLMSDAAWIEQIEKSPLVSELVADTDDQAALKSAYLHILSRFPRPAEEKLLVEHLHGVSDRKAAWTDIVWALVNSREFRTNH